MSATRRKRSEEYREWARNLPAHEVERIVRQLARAVEVARLMRSTPTPEPTRVLLPKQAEKIARGMW